MEMKEEVVEEEVVEEEAVVVPFLGWIGNNIRTHSYVTCHLVFCLDDMWTGVKSCQLMKLAPIRVWWIFGTEKLCRLVFIWRVL